MARGTQFAQLVVMLREELGRSNRASVSQDDVPGLERVIVRTYEQLYDQHDWPHLRVVFPRFDLAAGQRFYDPPEGLNVERIERVDVWQNGIPFSINRGVGVWEYAGFDSYAGERSDPAMGWDLRWDGDGESGSPQIEIWPIPSGSTKIEFTGIRAIKRLVDAADPCHLDDNMVVLFCAAQMLARQKSADAEVVAAAARARFGQMAGQMSGAAGTARKRWRMGLGPSDDTATNHRATVRISG